MAGRWLLPEAGGHGIYWHRRAVALIDHYQFQRFVIPNQHRPHYVRDRVPGRFLVQTIAEASCGRF